MDLSMEIDKILKARANQLTVNSNKLVVNSQLTSNLLTDKEIESIMGTVEDLVNPQFLAWHIGRLFKLGASEYLARADKARKFGRDKQRYFSNLVNKG